VSEFEEKTYFATVPLPEPEVVVDPEELVVVVPPVEVPDELSRELINVRAAEPYSDP
jgi:hypothetical protein